MTNALPSVQQYLRTHNVLCLATASDNLPWVAPVFYASDSKGLIFLSAPHTRHSKNIAINPNVSASIQQDYSEWQDIKGIQLEGVVSMVADLDRARLLTGLRKNFQSPEIRRHQRLPKQLIRFSGFILMFESYFLLITVKD